jgi:hypothetical protein
VGYFVAKLVAPGDALCKPILPELHEPVLTNIGHGLLVLRAFERFGRRRAGYGSGVAVRGCLDADCYVRKYTRRLAAQSLNLLGDVRPMPPA